MAKYLSGYHDFWGCLRKLTLVLPLLLLIGCSNDEGIRVYRVAKSDQHRGLLSQNGGSAPVGPAMGGGQPVSPAAQSEPVEMLSALIPRGKSYWVFKLTDEPEVMDKYRDEFRSIVKSISFDGSIPSWDLSDGWESKRSFGGIIYAELLKESAGLRATVTQMPLVRDWQDLVKENVGRWQGQLALEPSPDWDSVQQTLEEVTELSDGESAAYFVSLVGKGSGQMRGPFQTMNSSSISGTSTSRNTDSPSGSKSQGATSGSDGAQASSGVSHSGEPTGEPELAMQTRSQSFTVQVPADRNEVDFQSPANWKKLDVSESRMRLAAFQIGDGDQQAELTVIPARGSIDANLGMWFSQIQVQPDAETVQGVQNDATEVVVQGVDSQVYYLEGSESGQAILVADIPWRADESLFVKLKGTQQVVASSREDFLGFVKSLKWGKSANEKAAMVDSNGDAEPNDGERTPSDSTGNETGGERSKSEAEPASNSSEKIEPDTAEPDTAELETTKPDTAEPSSDL